MGESAFLQHGIQRFAPKLGGFLTIIRKLPCFGFAVLYGMGFDAFPIILATACFRFS